jgi:hypothetical protein
MKFNHTLALIDGRYYDANGVDTFLAELDKENNEKAPEPYTPSMTAYMLPIGPVPNAPAVPVRQHPFKPGTRVQWKMPKPRAMEPYGFIVLDARLHEILDQQYGDSKEPSRVTGTSVPWVRLIGVSSGSSYRTPANLLEPYSGPDTGDRDVATYRGAR